MMTEQRLKAIISGKISVEQLTEQDDKDIKKLEKRLFKLIAAKKLEDPMKIVFRTHGTLQ